MGPPHDTAVPTSIEDTPRFDVLRVLGTGSTCVVYEARDRHHGDIVAVKTLKHLDAASVYRLKQEFRALSHLDHPNLVQFYELLRSDEGWYVTMERVEGIDFLAWCRRSDPPEPPPAPTESLGTGASSHAIPDRTPGPLPDLIRLRNGLAQLAKAVQGLHAAGRIHRDLKPSNVLVTASGRVVVLDFGLVADVDPDYTEGTLQHQIAGSAAYMSPEQAMGRPLAEPTDWYAVGVMLYEALTGVWPIEGPLTQILHDKQREDPPAPSTLVPGIPGDLEDLAMALLSRDPAARPRGVEVLRRLCADVIPLPILEPRFQFRDTVLGTVRAHWDAAQHQDHPAVLAIRAVPGVGRTRFLRELVKDLRRSGAIVLKSRCYSWEGVPLRAIDGLVDNLTRVLRRASYPLLRRLANEDLSHLVALFPTFARVDALDLVGRADDLAPEVLRRRGMSELRIVLDVVATEHPLVLVVDDAHHADPDSADALADLLAPRGDAGALRAWVLVSTPTGSEAFVRWLSPRLAQMAIPLEVFDLPPITEGQAMSMAAELLALPFEDPVAHAVAAASGGNLARMVEGAWDVMVAQGRRQRASGRIDGLVAAAIDGLASEPRRLLEVLAVADAAVATEVALTAACPTEPFQVITALRAHRLVVRVDGDTLEIALAGVADYVLEQLSAEEARDLHRTVAEALARWGRASPRSLVRHWAEAGDLEQAAMVAWSGGLEARESGRWSDAVGLLTRALEHSGWRRPERASILASLGEVWLEDGSGRSAARCFLDAAEIADGSRRVGYRVRAAEGLLAAGEMREGIALLDEVLQGAGLPALPVRHWAGIVGHWRSLRAPGSPAVGRPVSRVDRADLARVDAAGVAARGLAILDPAWARAMVSVFQREAFALGESRRLAAAMALDGVTVSLLDLATRHPDDDVIRAEVSAAGGRAALGAGDWDRAIAAARDAEVSLSRAGTGGRWRRLQLRALVLRSQLWQGDLLGVRDQLGPLVSQARHHDDPVAWTELVGGDLALAAAADPEEGLAAIDAAQQRWAETIPPRPRVLLGIGRAWLCLAADRAAEALRTARRIPRVPDPWLQIHTARVLGMAAVLAGEWARAEAAATRLEDPTRPFTVLWADQIRWAVAHRRGDEGADPQALLQRLDAAELGLDARAIRIQIGEVPAPAGIPDGLARILAPPQD